MDMPELMSQIKTNLQGAETKREIHRRVRRMMTSLCEMEKDDEITFTQYCNGCRYLFDKAAEMEVEMQ